MSVDVRPMTDEDVDEVAAVVKAANEAAEREAGEEPWEPTPEQQEQFLRGMRRFVAEDGDGAWVATDDEGIAGMGEAIRRGDFWGLSMLFVHPRAQSQGVGRQLLDQAMAYAEGASVRMIMTSPDPRALRRYSLAGLAVHPACWATGAVDRSTIPADLPGRPGTTDDLDLVEAVDLALMGRSRAADAEFVLDSGGALEVVDDDGRRGFGLYRNGQPNMLGATDEETAALVLWRLLAATEGKTEVYCLTAQQDWAIKVALAARLKVKGGGPLCIDGMDLPPRPWIPSGWYF